MDSAIFTYFSIALIIFCLLALTLGKKLFRSSLVVGAFFAVYFADNLILLFSTRYNALQVIRSHVWEGFLVCNWSGKIYSVLMVTVLLILLRPRLSLVEAGLTLRQNRGSLLPASLAVLGLAVWAGWVGLCSPKGVLDVETLFFLALMPGLNEELVYRGALTGLLDKLLPGRLSLLAAQVGWGAVITTVLFALLHGFWLDGNLVVHVEWIALRNSALSGSIFAWLRARTGSLALPVIAHGLEDILFFLPRMISLSL